MSIVATVAHLSYCLALVQICERTDRQTDALIAIFRIQTDDEVINKCSIDKKSSAVAEMGDRLPTIDMGRKVGTAVSPFVEELGPHVTQYRLGRGLPPY